MIKGVSETIENQVRERKCRFLGILRGALGTILLGNMFACKGVIQAGEKTVRVGQGF